ncbi:MAG: hypothetical protein ACUVQ1_02985 [Candidatus Kapaibacteriales bacterium]
MGNSRKIALYFGLGKRVPQGIVVSKDKKLLIKAMYMKKVASITQNYSRKNDIVNYNRSKGNKFTTSRL